MDYEWSRLTDSLNSTNPQTIVEYVRTELEIKVLNSLQNGHANAIGLKDLCKLLNQKENRKVRLAIEDLRHQGYLILFGQKEKVYKIINGKNVDTKQVLPSGYYLATTQEEAQEFIAYMRSRIIAECLIMKDIRLAMIKKFTKQFGQLPLIR